MLKTIKVKVGVDEIIHFGTYVTCCNKRQWIGRYELEPCDHWSCDLCDKPLIMRGVDGLWYHVGDGVFE